MRSLRATYVFTWGTVFYLEQAEETRTRDGLTRRRRNVNLSALVSPGTVRFRPRAKRFTAVIIASYRELYKKRVCTAGIGHLLSRRTSIRLRYSSYHPQFSSLRGSDSGESVVSSGARWPTLGVVARGVA